MKGAYSIGLTSVTVILTMMMMLAAAAVVAEASSTCMTSDSAVTITPSMNITTASVDEQNDQQQQQPQDSVDDVTEDKSEITSGTESLGWFATVDTTRSSSCQLPTNNDAMHNAKGLPLIQSIFI